jgi:hypothetical protein
MPSRVPIFYSVNPSVGHGQTYNQDNGGPFGQSRGGLAQVAVAMRHKR